MYSIPFYVFWKDFIRVLEGFLQVDFFSGRFFRCFFPQASVCGFSNSPLRTQGGLQVTKSKIRRPVARLVARQFSAAHRGKKNHGFPARRFQVYNDILRLALVQSQYIKLLFFWWWRTMVFAQVRQGLTVCFLKIKCSRLRRGNFRYTMIS